MSSKNMLVTVSRNDLCRCVLRKNLDAVTIRTPISRLPIHQRRYLRNRGAHPHTNERLLREDEESPFAGEPQGDGSLRSQIPIVGTGITQRAVNPTHVWDESNVFVKKHATIIKNMAYAIENGLGMQEE